MTSDIFTMTKLQSWHAHPAGMQVSMHLCGSMVSVWHSYASVLQTIKDDFLPQETAAKSPLCLHLFSKETTEHTYASASCPCSSAVFILAQHTAFLSVIKLCLVFNYFMRYIHRKLQELQKATGVQSQEPNQTSISQLQHTPQMPHFHLRVQHFKVVFQNATEGKHLLPSTEFIF